MTTFRLIYCSQVAPGLEPAELDSILASARRRNRRNGVTGSLFFDGYHFVQALEGSSQDVNETFQRLSRDTRHHTVTLLHFGVLVGRGSPHGMSFAQPADAVELCAAEFRTRGSHFVPELFSPEKAEAFMATCTAHAKRV